jgi:disulfide bond formation protein DsbB
MRLKIILTTALVSGALVLAACGGSGAATEAPAVSAEAQKYVGLTPNVENGKKQFDATCTACHGPTGEGITGLGKSLVESEWTKTQGDADLALFLSKGRPTNDPLNTTGIDMPPKGGNPALKDQDLVDIVGYLRTIHK